MPKYDGKWLASWTAGATMVALMIFAAFAPCIWTGRQDSNDEEMVPMVKTVFENCDNSFLLRNSTGMMRSVNLKLRRKCYQDNEQGHGNTLIYCNDYIILTAEGTWSLQILNKSLTTCEHLFHNHSIWTPIVEPYTLRIRYPRGDYYHNLIDRKWHDPLTPKNKFETNVWYNFAKWSVHSLNLSDCYVCTKMPVSTGTPMVEVRPMHNPTDLFPDILQSRVSNGLLTNKYYNISVTPPYKGRNFTKMLRMNGTNPLFSQAIPLPEAPFPVCYANNRSLTASPIHLGEIDTTHCLEVVTPCSQAGLVWDTRGKHQKANCTSWYSAIDEMGLIPQKDVYWMCDHQIYITIPPDWIGICAPVELGGETYIVYASNDILQRAKREVELKPHDGVWGTDVPDDKKLWTTGQKVLYSLFPNIGVGKVALMIETLHFRMSSYINFTIAALDGLAEEVQALREMELQDRYVLDILAAPQGGVCAMVNRACCTFVPDNAAPEGKITKAIENLRKLAAMQEMDHQQVFKGVWAWLTGGAWWEILLKFLTPIIMILLLFCVLTTCIVPCLQSLMSKVISRTTAVTLLYQQESLALITTHAHNDVSTAGDTHLSCNNCEDAALTDIKYIV